MVSAYGMLMRKPARVCVLSEPRRISGELSILSRMAVALVPARGRRLTSGGRCVDFTPQPSALVRSASPPISAALAPGGLPQGEAPPAYRGGREEPCAAAARLHVQDGLAEYRRRPLHANPLAPAHVSRVHP